MVRRLGERFAADRIRVWELDEILALVTAARRPVGSFEYADTNYNVLGLVIEHVRQRPLVDVLRDGVLRVDGAERLIWQPDEAPTDPMAMPRGESRDALEQGGGYLPSISERVRRCCGGMASDSISLARWWRAFCAGEIVSEASLTEMSTFYDDDDRLRARSVQSRDGYAQGVGHMGPNFGYNSWAGCLTDDDLIVVVLTNFDSTSSSWPDRWSWRRARTDLWASAGTIISRVTVLRSRLDREPKTLASVSGPSSWPAGRRRTSSAQRPGSGRRTTRCSSGPPTTKQVNWRTRTLVI